ALKRRPRRVPAVLDLNACFHVMAAAENRSVLAETRGRCRPKQFSGAEALRTSALDSRRLIHAVRRDAISSTRIARARGFKLRHPRVKQRVVCEGGRHLAKRRRRTR